MEIKRQSLTTREFAKLPSVNKIQQYAIIQQLQDMPKSCNNLFNDD